MAVSLMSFVLHSMLRETHRRPPELDHLTFEDDMKLVRERGGEVGLVFLGLHFTDGLLVQLIQLSESCLALGRIEPDLSPLSSGVDETLNNIDNMLCGVDVVTAGSAISRKVVKNRCAVFTG